MDRDLRLVVAELAARIERLEARLESVQQVFQTGMPIDAQDAAAAWKRFTASLGQGKDQPPPGRDMNAKTGAG